MNNSKYFLFVAVVVIIGALLFLVNEYVPAGNSSQQKKSPAIKINTYSNNMEIKSKAFENNGHMSSKYSCDGDGMNPPLEFSEIPQNTMSLALLLHDPDAPMAGGFIHWLIFNMDPKTEGINENAKPASGIEGTNSAGKTGYVGPCPPSGTHRYVFTLYALDEILKFDSTAQKNDIEKAIAGHIIAQAELIGLYQRK